MALSYNDKLLVEGSYDFNYGDYTAIVYISKMHCRGIPL